MDTTDHGPDPYVINIEELTLQNERFRVAKWTGQNLQMTVMAVAPGGEVGLEVHSDHDQFLRIEYGQGRVEMGPDRDHLEFVHNVEDDDAIFVPAGTWHNLINTSDKPLKLYSIYAPAEHPPGTVHDTFEDDPEHT